MSVKQVNTVDLEFFYKENKQPEIEVEYVASESFVNPETGQPIPWKIRALSADEEAAIRNRATETKVDKRTGVINEIFHDQDYTVAITAQAIVFPPLTDRGIQKSYGVDGAGNLLRKMLNAGELQSLALKVIEVSGLDDIEGQKTDNELKGELVKNN